MTSPQQPRQVRIDQLERATMRLSEQVGGLSSALASVTDIQVRQTLMDERQADLEANVMPRKEIDDRAAQLSRELGLYRHRLLHRVYGGAVLLCAVLLSIGVVLTNYMSAQEADVNRQCEQRNAGIRSSRTYFIAVRDASTNETLRAAADKVLQGYQVIKCGGSQ